MSTILSKVLVSRCLNCFVQLAARDRHEGNYFCYVCTSNHKLSRGRRSCKCFKCFKKVILNDPGDLNIIRKKTWSYGNYLERWTLDDYEIKRLTEQKFNYRYICDECIEKKNIERKDIVSTIKTITPAVLCDIILAYLSFFLLDYGCDYCKVKIPHSYDNEPFLYVSANTNTKIDIYASRRICYQNNVCGQISWNMTEEQKKREKEMISSGYTPKNYMCDLCCESIKIGVKLNRW